MKDCNLKFAEIILKDTVKPLEYRIPDEIDCNIGHQVEIELGRRRTKGWVNELKTDTKFKKTKSQLSFIESSDGIKSILKSTPIFPKQQLELFLWMSKYYGVDLNKVLDTALPKIVETKARKKKKEREAIFKGDKPKQLSPYQAKAIEKINKDIESNQFRPTLLFGVTGSGKTEVYMSAIEKCLEQEKSALVVIPEIALSPQFIDRFSSRLNTNISLLHSAVGPSQKWRNWKALLSGEVMLALGARSAVFAPMKNLGLIVVDEEHESTYKQSDGLRYHARDVAVMRAKLNNCPVILGSATPSFESLINVKEKKYKLIELPERATKNPLPTIEIVNLNTIKKKEKPSENISPQLFTEINKCLSKNEQVIILYNRRGFASYIQCETCSEVLLCPSCSIALTYHQSKSKMLCHICDHSKKLIEKCPSCWNEDTAKVEDEDTDYGLLKPQGSGTEKVIEELSTLFPKARLIRMDRDTVGKKDSYRKILTAMKNNEADILVGTQMIAKGHDLPGVTLVGIVDADVGLHMPDFRSSEKAFQLITQVSGRAGRGDTKGKVILQTRQSDHPTIVAAVTGRFKAFARFEINNRTSLNYPPYGKLLRAIISSPSKQDAFNASIGLKEFFKKNNKDENITILGPSPCFYEKVRNRYRWNLVFKSNSSKSLSILAHKLNAWRKAVKGYEDLRVGVDIDAVDMF